MVQSKDNKDIILNMVMGNTMMGEYYTGQTDLEPKAIFERYKDIYSKVSNDEITQIREKYIIIDIDSLEHDMVRSTMVKHSYFDNPQKTEAVCDMLYYYLTHKDKYIYQKTDYLCNKKEKFCLCNTYAETLQSVFTDSNATSLNRHKTISWFKKI